MYISVTKIQNLKMLAGWTLATPFILLLLPLLTIQESEDRFGMRLAAQLERGSVGLKPNSLFRDEGKFSNICKNFCENETKILF
jgi:hypothetical protein